MSKFYNTGLTLSRLLCAWCWDRYVKPHFVMFSMASHLQKKWSSPQSIAEQLTEDALKSAERSELNNRTPKHRHFSKCSIFYIAFWWEEPISTQSYRDYIPVWKQGALKTDGEKLGLFKRQKVIFLHGNQPTRMMQGHTDWHMPANLHHLLQTQINDRHTMLQA